MSTENDRYELILSVATEGFWDWDLKTDRAYLSPRYCELIGYPPDGQTVFDSSFLNKILHPDDRDLVMSAIADCIEGKRETAHLEHRLVAQDGTIHWVDGRGKIIEYDQSGRPVRMVGTIVDITARKRAEQALQESQSLLDNLSMQVPGALFQSVLAPDGRVYTPYASQKLNDVYELSPSEIRDSNEPIFQRFHSDDYDRVMGSIFEATRKVEKWQCEYRVTLPRQGLKWLYGVALPVQMNDGTVIFYGIIIDITERKAIEETLNHSQKLLASIVENAPSAFFVKEVKEDFRVILWNKAAEDIFGIKAADILGKNAAEVWPKSLADQYLESDRAVAASRTPADIPESTSLHPQKGIIYLHTRKIPLFDSTGSVSHVVVICDDISEHRMMLAELVKNQKLESLGVLAGGIAHDFNNILTGVTGNISFARAYLEDSHPATGLLIKAEKAARRAGDLAHQLLTFSKGGQPVKRALSVRHLVEESVSFVLRGSNVTSEILIPEHLPAVDVDEGQINQVLNNIVINAAQAMPGGGTITIQAEMVFMEDAHLIPLPAGCYVKLSLNDTGCGIPADLQQRIFDPYFTTKATGNGLGLASAHSIIKKHGGQIRVHSTVGVGTSFEIFLPASDKGGMEGMIKKATVTFGEPKGLSILVMDDEEIIRDMTAMILNEVGYTTERCSSGEEAVERYRVAYEAGSPFSVVIMDLTVPGGMGGKEAARQIIDLDPDARMIVSSGYSHDPIMANFAEYGFCAALLKPYDLERIVDTINSVLHLTTEEPN